MHTRFKSGYRVTNANTIGHHLTTSEWSVECTTVVKNFNWTYLQTCSYFCPQYSFDHWQHIYQQALLMGRFNMEEYTISVVWCLCVCRGGSSGSLVSLRVKTQYGLRKQKNLQNVRNTNRVCSCSVDWPHRAELPHRTPIAPTPLHGGLCPWMEVEVLDIPLSPVTKAREIYCKVRVVRIEGWAMLRLVCIALQKAVRK